MGGSGRGLALVLVSSAAFGSSGPFAKSLLDAGWSPGAAVLVRSTGGAVLLGVVALLLWRRRLSRLLSARRTVVVYGVFAVAGVQVCYFTAVQTLSVGVALLVEYLAPVLVVGWLWLRTGRRPSARTLAGGALALVGIVGVLDVVGGVRVDPVGVLWALAAAMCLACYFLVLGREPGAEDRLDPAVLATAGLVVGAVVVGVAALVGLVPVAFGAATTSLAGRTTSAWVPALALVLGCTVVAYLAGAAGMARLGATTGSLVSLAEVLFAVLTAWLLLGQRVTPVQLVGTALVVVGVGLAITGGRPDQPALPDPVAPVPAGPLSERGVC